MHLCLALVMESAAKMYETIRAMELTEPHKRLMRLIPHLSDDDAGLLADRLEARLSLQALPRSQIRLVRQDSAPAMR